MEPKGAFESITCSRRAVAMLGYCSVEAVVGVALSEWSLLIVWHEV